MVKNVSWAVACGLAVAMLLPLIAGCSSHNGCRTCRKEPAGLPANREAADARVGAGGPAPPSGPASVPTAALAFGGQKMCPVTGEGLGSMGKPITVTVKGETVYVCCRGCAAKAQADPAKTLAAVAADRAR